MRGSRACVVFSMVFYLAMPSSKAELKTSVTCFNEEQRSGDLRQRGRRQGRFESMMPDDWRGFNWPEPVGCYCWKVIPLDEPVERRDSWEAVREAYSQCGQSWTNQPSVQPPLPPQEDGPMKDLTRDMDLPEGDYLLPFVPIFWDMEGHWREFMRGRGRGRRFPAMCTRGWEGIRRDDAPSIVGIVCPLPQEECGRGEVSEEPVFADGSEQLGTSSGKPAANSAGLVAGIVSGLIVLVAAVIVGALIFRWHRRKDAAAHTGSGEEAPVYGIQDGIATVDSKTGGVSNPAYGQNQVVTPTGAENTYLSLYSGIDPPVYESVAAGKGAGFTNDANVYASINPTAPPPPPPYRFSDPVICVENDIYHSNNVKVNS